MNSTHKSETGFMQTGATAEIYINLKLVGE